MGVTLACGVLAIAAWIAALVLWPEQAIEITGNLFYQLLAPLTIGLVSGVTSGLIVAGMLESKRGLKADLIIHEARGKVEDVPDDPSKEQ